MAEQPKKAYRQIARKDKLFAWRAILGIEIACKKEDRGKEEEQISKWMNSLSSVLRLEKPTVNASGRYDDTGTIPGGYQLSLEYMFEGTGYSFGQTNTIFSAFTEILTVNELFGIDFVDFQIFVLT